MWVQNTYIKELFKSSHAADSWRYEMWEKLATGNWQRDEKKLASSNWLLVTIYYVFKKDFVSN